MEKGKRFDDFCRIRRRRGTVRKRDRNARFEGTLMEPIKSYEDSYGYVRVRNVEAAWLKLFIKD